MRLASFLYGTTVAVMNPLEKKLEKRTSVRSVVYTASNTVMPQGRDYYI